MFIHTDMIDEITYLNEHYKEFEPKCPIVIPSYQNREGTILKDLKSLTNNKVILFIYDIDYDNYKQYLENPNVEIVTIKEKWRSIQRKRHWIQVYLANERPEIENYIMVDDDLKKSKLTCYKESKQIDSYFGDFLDCDEDQLTIQNDSITSKYIPVKNALGILEHLHKKYSNTVSGGAGENTGILSGKVVHKNKYFYQVFCFNNKWLKDNPQCMFRDMQNVSEDNVLWYDCYNNNQPYYAFECLYFECNNQRVKTYNSIASTPINRIRNDINALRIMKHNTKLHWSKEWNCWAVRFVPGFVQTPIVWDKVKSILDTNLPNWQDINNNYTEDEFTKTFNILSDYLKPLFNEDKNETNWKCVNKIQ